MVENRNNNVLAQIASLVEAMEDAEQAVVEAEEWFKLAKEKFKQLQENDIPDLMDECGVAEIVLTNGSKLSLVDKIVGSITKAHEAEAHQWLEDHGCSSLLKTEFRVGFGMGDDYQAKQLESYLMNFNADMQRKTTVHPSTLHAFVRQQLEDGVDFPMDVFGVYRKRQAKIKR